MTQVTINAQGTAETNQTVNLTSAVTGQNTTKTLNLVDGGTFTFNKNIPFEFTVTELDDTTTKYASIANNSGVIGAYLSDDNWLRGSDGALIYGNDNQILEGTA